MSLKYTINKSENQPVISLEGNFMAGNEANVVLDEIIRLISEGKINCTIDLTKVKYMDSSGLSILMRVLTMLRNKGGELTLKNPSEHIKKMLIITKLNAIFNVI